MDYESLSGLVEQGPSRFARPIAPDDAGAWHRVILVGQGDGLDYELSAAALDADVRIRSGAVYRALRDGLNFRDRSWVILEGAEAARLLPALGGVEILASPLDLPLTPLFAYRRIRAGVGTDLDEVYNVDRLQELIDEHDLPQDLTELELPAGQHGFLDPIEIDGARVVPLDRRYGRVARALMGKLVIQRASWQDVPDVDPDADVLVPLLRFEGETPNGKLGLRGACVLEHRLRVPSDPGGGAEQPASWMVARPTSGPSWLIAPSDLEVMSNGLLTALLLHLRATGGASSPAAEQ